MTGWALNYQKKMTLNKLFKKIFPKVSIFTQKELIDLKSDLFRRKVNTEESLIKTLEKEDADEFLHLYNHRRDILSDLQKVKLKLAFKNVILAINSYIFKRDYIKEEYAFLEKISKKRNGYKEFFILLKQRQFVIEESMQILKRKISKMNKQLSDKNNGLFLGKKINFFSNSILKLKTV